MKRFRLSIAWYLGCALILSACGNQGNADPARPDVPSSPDYRSTVGEWSPVIDAQVVPIDMNLLPTGEVLYWQRGDSGDLGPRIWNPQTGVIRTLAAALYDIFCSGHSFLPDGTLFVAGGHIADFVGEKRASIFDPSTERWSLLPAEMNAGRWYPTTTTLATGEVLVVSGAISAEQRAINDLPQVWKPSNSTWRNLTGATKFLPLYPFMYPAPNGSVFYAGPGRATAYLDPTGAGHWTHVADTNFGQRFEGTSVMYADGKVLLVGGDEDSDGEQSPTATAEIIDLHATTPAWQPVSPMANPRKYHAATVLPDGKVLVTGGTASPGFNDAAGAVYAAELWDPETDRWSSLAAMQVSRVYHSGSLLLPDGRVLVGGGGQPASAGTHTHPDFEVYSPPYLFKGSRPVITSAPSTIKYGEPFLMETPVAAEIASIRLIRLPSTTHGFDQNQQTNQLPFVQMAAELTVTPPSDEKMAAPGHYMLFILTKDGVPSTARIVQLTR